MEFSKLVFGALAANPDIVTPHATAYANNASANSYTIDEILAPRTLDILNEEMKDIPVVYTAKKPVNSGDHPAAAAMRSVARQMYEKSLALYTHSSILHIGATARQFLRFKDTKNHHFALHGSEAKDEGRNSLLVNMLKEKIYQAFTKAEMLAGFAERDTQMSEASRLHKTRLATWQTKMSEKLMNGHLITDADYKQEAALKKLVKEHSAQVRSFKAHVNRKTSNGVNMADFGPNTTANKFRERVKAFEIADLSDIDTFTQAFDSVMGLEARVFSTRAFSNGVSMKRNKLTGFDVLTFEDVGYDFTDFDWLEYFYQTGASTGFVLGIFPLDLIFDHLTESRVYNYETLPGGKARLSFPNAFSHSYEHNVDNWSRLIRSPFIRGGGAYDFDLHCETKSRVGPYAIIEIHKVAKGKVQSYIVEAPRNRHTVSVLRPSSIQYVTIKGQRVVDYTKAKRFDFPETQWNTLISFFLTLDVKSQTLTNMLSYTRRAFEGISLVKGVEATHWLHFDQELIPDLCGAALMYCVTQLRDQQDVITNFDSGSKILKSNMAPIPTFVRSLFGPMSLAAEFIFTPVPAERLYDFLVYRRQWRRDLSDMVPSSRFTPFVPDSMRTIFLDANMFSEAATPCPVCKSLSGKLGKQKVCCQFRVNSSYDVTFTEDECLRLKVDLLAQSNGATGGLFETLTEAAKSMLVATQQHQVRVEYIRGGPGVGKSYLIRSLYPGMDLATIAVPLIELLNDYPRTEVKTTHKFMKAGSKKILFVDEFSIFDGRVLRYMIARYKVDIVYIVGDTAQNRILPEHGEYIGSIFDLDSVSTHSLHVNFRTDSRYIVSRLNKEVGYNMITTSGIDRLPIVKDLNDLANDMLPDGEVFTLRFSDNAEEYCKGSKSISSVQGKTCDVARLILSKYDKALSSSSGQFVVSVSRQKKDLIIYADLEETHGWEFWSKLGYKAVEHLSDDGKTVKYIMEPTQVAMAYMDIPQTVPNNVELSEDLRTVRKIWSQAVSGDIVCRLPNSFVAENYHYIRSFVSDSEIKCSLDDVLLSIKPEKTQSDVFELLRQFGMYTISDEDVCNAKYVYIPSEDRWTTHANYIAQGINDINFDDANEFGVAVKKCFLRALRDAGASKPVLFSASKLCNLTPGGVSDKVATTFILENASEKIGLWQTTAGYSHPLVNTPYCKNHIELVDGHWQVKVKRRVMKIAGSEKHLPSLKTVLTTAIDSKARASGNAFLDLFKTTILLADKTDLIAIAEKKKVRPSASVLKAMYTPQQASEALEIMSLLDQFQRLPYRENQAVLNYDKDSDEFELVPAAGQGLTIDFLETGPVKQFDAEAEIFRSHLPTIAIYDRPLFVTHEYEHPSRSVEELGQVPSDSYLFGPEHLPVSFETRAFSTLNERAASFFSELSATNGKLNPNILAPPMKKNTIRAQQPDKRAVTIGEGLHYAADNQAQTIATVVKRYLQPSRNAPSVSGRLKAKQIARHVAQLVLRPGARLDVDTQEAIFRKHTADAHKRNYANRMLASGEWNQSRVDFSMKDIFKPLKAEAKLDKVGQGISASSPYVNFAFGGGFRVMTACLQYALKENVIIDNGYTESQFADMVGEQLEKLPGKPNTCVLDVEAMDSTQNWFTQEMEKEFWRLVGIDPTFVDEYFNFRSNYPIFYKNLLKATIESAKASGMPDTLIGNCIIIMMMTLWGVKHTGVFFMIVKGDDCALWAYNIKYNEDAMNQIKPYSRFKFSMDVNVPMEFCGNALEGKFICPDLYRTLRKITGNRFRDYEHWTQYQQSLRDRVSLIWSLGFTKVVQINAARCGVSEARMMDVLYTIVSYSQLNKEQWEEHFVSVKYPDPYRRA